MTNYLAISNAINNFVSSIQDTVYITVIDTVGNAISESNNLPTYITAFTAILAVVLTTISLYFYRKHNILSVKPIPSLQYYIGEKEINIELCNEGLGPMIVDKMLICSSNDQKSSVGAFSFECWNAGSESIIRSGDKVLLFDLKLIKRLSELDKITMMDLVTLVEILNNLTMDLQYHDIYDKKHPKYIIPIMRADIHFPKARLKNAR